MHFRSLCFSGGGITGVAHLGFLKALEDERLLGGIDTVVGTSVGAIVGTLYALGFDSSAMYSALLSMNRQKLFNAVTLNNISTDAADSETFVDQLVDVFDILFTEFGLDDGRYLMAYLVDMLLNRGLDPRITFEQLHSKFKKRLIITATNLSAHRPEYFSLDTHPNMRVLDAVRVSVSIPFLFTSIEMDNQRFVDGSVCDNYSIEHCIQDFTNRYPLSVGLFGVIGCCLNGMPPRNTNDFGGFVFNLLASTIKKGGFRGYTVNVDLNELSSIDFNASPVQLDGAFDAGREACALYLRSLRGKSSLLISRRRSV